jgi:hypothetical protein
MTLQDIKNINIREYLGGMGVKPQKEDEYKGMYHSPFREDRNASFKVDYGLNVWHDFGTGEGGSIIDLVMKMEHCSFHKAASLLEKEYAEIDIHSFSFHQNRNEVKTSRNESSILIQDILPISHPKLAGFVRERNMDLELAKQYCHEIHYKIRDKSYFSIGFKNDKGGYELSSPPNFKSCISPKDITTVRNKQNVCLVFEGFWDFLSYFMLTKTSQTQYDFAVLNSVANIQKAMGFVQSHPIIYTYLDNDEAGQKATQLIKDVCRYVNDRSTQYTGYKDLNDYLCQKSKVKPSVKKKNFGLKR